MPRQASANAGATRRRPQALKVTRSLGTIGDRRHAHAYNPPMLRRTLALLLILATWWSTGAQAAGGFALGAVDEHAVLHWSGTGHHHHDHDHDHDGADEVNYHVDDSSESAQHLMADLAGGVAALVGHCAFALAHLRPGAPGEGQIGRAHV